jgi:hypothetical protein
MRLHLPNGMLRRPDADLSDLTASVPAGAPYWDADEVDVLVYPLDPEPSPSEQAAIRLRLVTNDAAEETRVRDLRAALADQTTPAWARLTLQAELAKYGES